MSGQGLASKGSAALSLLLLAVVLVLVSSAALRSPEPRPARPAEVQAPAPAEVPKEEALDARVVVLPPPPSPAPPQTSTRAPAPDLPKATPEPASPPRAVRALQARPRPKSVDRAMTLTALKPQPRQATSVPGPLVPAPPPRDRPKTVVKPLPKLTPTATTPRPRESDLAPKQEVAAKPGPQLKPDAKAQQTMKAEGRALLRLLEHGAGPSIELAWPKATAGRRALFARLRGCHGMQVALMDGQGQLFVAGGKPGSAWALNLDRYSGFVRRPSGRQAEAEAQEISRLRRHHRGLSASQAVRVFPRQFDAVLLGGLRALLGGKWMDYGSIRARYRLDGRRLVVEGIEADGRSVPGRVDLSFAAVGTCPAA